MFGAASSVASVREDFVAELTDAALQVTARLGVRGPSVDQELELWKALGKVVRKPNDADACETLVADATDAAYEVALRHGFPGSFLDLRLGLWQALRRVFREGRFAVRLCRSPGPASQAMTYQVLC